MKLTGLIKRLSCQKCYSSISRSRTGTFLISSQSSALSSSSSCSSSSSSFISTPIFYVNGSPHIGHAHSAILADALHRWRFLKGDGSSSSIFSTGTDEHGVKVAQAAQRLDMTPAQLCDKMSQEFRGLFDMLNVEYTDFVRTTEERHRLAVECFWKILHEKGYIYKGSYSGWYTEM